MSSVDVLLRPADGIHVNWLQGSWSRHKLQRRGDPQSTPGALTLPVVRVARPDVTVRVVRLLEVPKHSRQVSLINIANQGVFRHRDAKTSHLSATSHSPMIQHPTMALNLGLRYPPIHSPKWLFVTVPQSKNSSEPSSILENLSTWQRVVHRDGPEGIHRTLHCQTQPQRHSIVYQSTNPSPTSFYDQKRTTTLPASPFSSRGFCTLDSPGKRIYIGQQSSESERKWLPLIWCTSTTIKAGRLPSNEASAIDLAWCRFGELWPMRTF